MNDLPDLRSWLKSHPSDGAELSLPRAAVKALHDELQRLLQSNERLRKQNRKVRNKVTRIKGGEAVDLDDLPGPDAIPDQDPA